MATTILPIVEGQSEIESVRILLTRIFNSYNVYNVSVAKPFRVKRTKVVKNGELERAVKQSIRSRQGVECVFVILDADDDCPAELGPALLKRAKAVTELPVSIVLAQREFECWFLGAKESLRGKRGIRDDATAPSDPEEVRGAKERLRQNMTGGRRYLEVDDQPAFAECMDIDQAKSRCPSFARLVRAIESLVGNKD